MGTEYVTAGAGGGSFAGWKKVEVTAALDEAARSFTLETSERPGQFAFPPGTPITILATGALLVDGFVNKYHASGAAKTHQVRIAGRGKGQDFIDGSAVHPKGHAKMKSPVKFANEFQGIGTLVRDEIGLEPVDYQQIYQGETGFRFLERALRPHGATQMGNADGSISVTNASRATRAGGALIEGVNILEWSVDFDDSGRSSDYTVKGQRREGTKDEDLHIKESAQDSGVKRYRPRVIVHETDTDKKRAKNRAMHEKEKSAGKGTKAQITTQGWRDGGGALWTPNSIVFVSSPVLMHLVQDMLIEKIVFSQDDKSGTTAQLSLVDPRAHRGQGQSGGGSDAAWNAGM